jgi:peptide-methionine (R)-S-oxide reductase
MTSFIDKSASLTPGAYQIIANKKTEPAFTESASIKTGKGSYLCRRCGLALFRADSKFASGCGWPSFDRPLGARCVEEHQDATHGMQRTEVVCSHCDAHLGHIFPDGPPETTSLRYCINSVSLEFHPDE